MQLEEFLHMKDKGKANNSVKDEFKEEFNTFLSENGINDKSAEYAVSCIPLGSTEVANKWLETKEQDECRNQLKTLFDSDAFLDSKNRLNACAFVLRIIGLNSGVYHNQVVVEEAIKAVPIFACGNGGNIQKGFTRIVKSHLMGTLGIHISFIPLDKLDIDKDILSTFSKILNTAVIEMFTENLNDKDKRKADLIQEWVAPYCVEIINNQDEESNNKTDVSATKDMETGKNESQSEQNNCSKLVSNIYEIAEKVQNLEDQITQYSKLKSMMNSAIKEKEKEIDKLRLQLADSTAEINELKNEISELKEDIKLKEESITSLDEDVQKRDQFIEFKRQENKVSELEKLNTIGADLKIYYEDLQEAKTMELNSDVAGVLLDDLENIFRVLKDYGIEAK